MVVNRYAKNTMTKPERSDKTDKTDKTVGSMRVQRGLAEMLKGGVIMDVVTPGQAKIAEDSGAIAVMALERVPADIRRDGGVARMSDPEMIEGYQDRFGIEICNNFGSNEGVSLISNATNAADPLHRARWFQRYGRDAVSWTPPPPVQISPRLLDPEDGSEILTAGHAGELQITGPTVFDGYLNAPQINAESFATDGWFRTGDLFEIGGEQLQYYRHVGRSKDLVIRGGMNISSEEIEGLLAGCPGIKEVAVVGVPDRILGEKLCACVVYAGPQALSLAELLEFLKQQRVAAFKLPEYLLALPALPRNPLGKILKRELREQARALAPETV